MPFPIIKLRLKKKTSVKQYELQQFHHDERLLRWCLQHYQAEIQREQEQELEDIEKELAATEQMLLKYELDDIDKQLAETEKLLTMAKYEKDEE
eukprot:4723464-Amphidinium_carterae.1